MAVPARPASAAPIESSWGGVVHDAIVAQDIQVGTATVVTTAAQAAGSVVVTFPRPFAAPPVVVATVATSTGVWVAVVYTSTPTTATVAMFHRAGTNLAASVPVNWIAYGPRA